MHPDALFARALALEDAGRAEEALEHYRRLLRLSPGHADAWHNHGLLLVRLGRLTEAEKSHRGYIASVPDSSRAHSNLADVLLALGKYADAVASLDHVLRRSPEDAPALVRRGVALSCLRRFSEARESFEFARSRHPIEVARFVGRVAPGSELGDMLSPENIFISRCYAALGQADWSNWDAFVAEMRRAASEPDIVLEPAVAFMVQHLPLSGFERHAIARGIAARIEARVPALAPPPPRARSRIRIGVLSPDFREHLNAYLLLPLFELLDRARFEVYAYSLMPDDGSAARARIVAAADGFSDLHTVSDEEAALRIRADDVDILLDVGGHTTGGRFAITARRPARVQALYLGFSCSLGSKRLDHVIVDRIVGPSEDEWSELRAYLPDTYYLYDFRAPVPDASVSRSEYGLPDDAFVFCAFHKAEKISPDTFNLWLEILRGVPRSVLWCLALPPAAIRNLRSYAAAHGVDPSRLVFAPFEQQPRYLARQRLGDLFLDAIHHNAMTTACDALGAGLPVLTMRGATMASRAGESLLRAAGLPDLVAAGHREFIQTAVRLASEPSLLSEVRGRLSRNRNTAPLFDTVGRVRELEQAFEGIFQVSAHMRSRL